MSIVRVNPSGWAFGAKFSSAQGNALDLNTTYALDKRAGQTDTLGSVVSTGGSGKIVAATAGGLTVSSGGTCEVASGGVINVNAGATQNVYGSLRVNGGAELRVLAAGSLNCVASSDVIFSTNIQLNNAKRLVYVDPRTIVKAYRAETSIAFSSWQIAYTGTTVYGLTASSTGATLVIPLDDPPDGATITNVELIYVVSGAARSPATRLNLGMWTMPHGTLGAPSSLAAAPSNPVPAYTTFNAVLSSNFAMTQNNVVDALNNRYWVAIGEESGTNAVAGNRVHAVRVTYSNITNAPLA